MTITHAGFTFVGVAEEVKFGEWQRAPQYTSAFGTPGVSVIDSNRTARDLEVRMYMYGNFETSTEVYSVLGTADARIGRVGTFVDNGLQSKTLKNVELVSLVLEEGPLPTAPDGGWIAIVLLKFRQLNP